MHGNQGSREGSDEAYLEAIHGKERYLQIGNNDVLSILNVYKTCFEGEIKGHGYFLSIGMESHCPNNQPEA